MEVRGQFRLSTPVPASMAAGIVLERTWTLLVSRAFREENWCNCRELNWCMLLGEDSRS